MIKRSSITPKWTILTLLLLAFELRTYRVTTIPLAVDEASTIGKYVPLSVIEIFATNYSNNHPLASALAHFFSPQAENLFLMRWPMILLGILSLPFIYLLGAKLFHPRIGTLALLLATVTPVHLAYSVVLRGYIGLIALMAMSLFFLWRALQRNHWQDWLAFTVVNFIAPNFHLFSALALGSQLGVVGLWLLGNYLDGNYERLADYWQQFRPLLGKLGLAVLVLAAVNIPLIYLRTTAILSEGGWPDDVGVWRDGIFSFPDDISLPFKLIQMMSPLAPGGLGAYVYLTFFVVSLIYLGLRQRIWAILAVAWFIIPFAAIFVALQLSPSFYVYLRFLLYLLPSFLVLVALGMVSLADWFLNLVAGQSWRWQMGIRSIIGAGAFGLLILLIVSTTSYIFRITRNDWPGIAKTLSNEIKPQDIVICEEGHGFDVPDRAKAHCVWALDLLVPDLKHYTFRLQSSTNWVANYNNMLQNRTTMTKQGDVWLVLWRKTPLTPEYLPLDNTSMLTHQFPPSPTAFAPYWNQSFGSAVLVRVGSKNTLFDNIYQTLELLLRIEPSPADKARYYRSLAEMEAVQGHPQKAREFFDQSWAMVEQSGGQYPELFLADTASIINRLPDNEPPPQTASWVDGQFGPSLNLQAYQIWPTTIQAGRPITLTLYWKTLGFIKEDYTFFVRLDDKINQHQKRLEFQPFDRIYPTTWWWAGQQLVERREFVFPPDLSAHDYVVQFGLYDSQSPDQQIVKPLFLLLHQTDEPEQKHWNVEIISDLLGVHPDWR